MYANRTFLTSASQEPGADGMESDSQPRAIGNRFVVTYPICKGKHTVSVVAVAIGSNLTLTDRSRSAYSLGLGCRQGGV